LSLAATWLAFMARAQQKLLLIDLTPKWSAATNTGNQSAATMEGKHGVAASIGFEGKAMAVDGSAIVLCYRNDKGELLRIKAGIAGRDIEPNKWYILNAQGEFEEVKP
jgi:hypothetical protein